MRSVMITDGTINVTLRELTSTKEMLDAARVTVWKGEAENEPSKKFIHTIYRSEHSPIRDRMFVVTIEGVESWVSTHFARHHVGVTPYISTQRDDRIGKKRDSEAPVNCRLTINSQSLIDMAQRRLCKMSHKKTIHVMTMIHECVKELDPELAKCMVPQCVYRGFCPEGKPACYDARRKERDEYLDYQCGVGYEYTTIQTPSWKQRFVKEYNELCDKLNKLIAMIDNWDNLPFKPECHKSLLEKQARSMWEYKEILESRAIIEGIELTKEAK